MLCHAGTVTSRLPASRLATLLLMSVTAVWGSTFFLIRDLVEHVPSADFLAVRFAIAAVVMAAGVPAADPWR